MRCGGGTASESIQTFLIFIHFSVLHVFYYIFCGQIYKTKESGVLLNVGFSVRFILFPPKTQICKVILQ